MKFLTEIKNIKARIFLNKSLDDNEIFSIAINAKNCSDQKSFDEALKLLSKPLSKQSNILLLELFRISMNNNDSQLAHKLLKILLRKTNQSFVIHAVLNSQNINLRAKLIESIKQNKKLKVNNKIYLLFMLWKMKRIPRKLLYKEVKTDLDKLLKKYQFDINNNVDFDSWHWEYEQDLIRKKFLLRVMRATIFLAKIGYSGKAIKFFKKAFGLFKSSNPHNYQDYFKNNNWGWGDFNKERRFTDGICNFDDITQYLDTDFEAFFKTPYNQNELEIARLKTTNALNFATEFAEYSNNINILKIMFPIHLSQSFIHKNIFAYISLIERVNKNDFDQDWAEKINNYFFNTHQHYSSKIAFLGLSKEIRQKNNINENKIKDLFTNRVLRGRLRGLFYYSSYQKKIEYCGGCSNSIAFKFVYEKADKEIKDWLEDLFIAKKLTDRSGEFSERNLDTQEVIYFKKMFSKKIGEDFYNNIEEKIRRLSHQGILSKINLSNDVSVSSACILLKDARNSGNFKEGIKFLKQIKRYSGKKVYYRNKLRKDYVLEQGKKDYISSKMFRAEMSKFLRAFLELNLKDQKKLFSGFIPLNDFILPYCGRETFAKYLHQDPYCMFRSLRSQTVLESVRIKKGLKRMRSLSDKNFDTDYRKYVSKIIKTDYFHGDQLTKIIYFLEEAERRYSGTDFQNKLANDLNQIPCKAQKLLAIDRILKGDGWFAFGRKPNQAVSNSLSDFRNKFLDEIKDMSAKELEDSFDDEKIRSLLQSCNDSLNGFLLEKIPHKVIHRLIDDYKIFENHANPQTLKDGLERSTVKNAIRNACNDLSTTNTFHFNNSWFARSIFKKFGGSSFLDSFQHWDKECLQIIEESVASIYQNMANVSLIGLKSLNFKSKKHAKSFDNCIDEVISIEGDLEAVKDFRKKHIKIYDAIEAAAQKLLKRDKISKLTGKTFLNVIDRLLKNEQGAAKAYLGNANFQKFKVILKNCALHIIKINNISIKNLYLDDQELGLEVMKNYLQSMDAFDPEYKTALNNMPLSKDIVTYSRKYNAPYWANSLKIYL